MIKRTDLRRSFVPNLGTVTPQGRALATTRETDPQLVAFTELCDSVTYDEPKLSFREQVRKAERWYLNSGDVSPGRYRIIRKLATTREFEPSWGDVRIPD